jgi:hypothetical protein
MEGREMPDEKDIIAETEPVRRHRRSEMIAVRVISTDNKASLVEYTRKGILKRVSIPADELTDGDKASLEVLEAGIVYGEDWEAAVKGIEINKERLADEVAGALRARGIWTPEDMLLSAAPVRAALTEACSFILSGLLEYSSRKHKQK